MASAFAPDRILAGVAMAVLAYIALGGAMIAAAGPLNTRGEMIDIGGRRLRLVCEGPGSAEPLILLESGAFGSAADWGVVQPKLTALGLRSCAYDRAGMGLSNPGPKPRDGLAIAADFEALLKAAGLPGPYVLVGHSMAGLRLRQFAGRNPGQVQGVVLVDAATPEALSDPQMRQFIGQFASATRWAGVGASVGLFAPLAGSGLGNKIGLSGEAEREKRRFFANGRHNRTAAEEVAQWPAASEQAGQAPPFPPNVPVAVITAGGVSDFNRTRKAMQAAPAEASSHGYVDHVAGAGHNTLLGPLYADHIVKGVEFVLAHR